MVTVLVTGASGFIGRRTVTRLVEGGHEVHALSRHARDRAGDVRWEPADLFDAAAVRAVVDRVVPTHLAHLAWTAQPPDYLSSAVNLDWVAASIGLVRAFAAAGGRRLLVVGTSAEYGASLEPCVEDVTELSPTTLYGASKAALLGILRAAAPGLGMSLVWPRLFQPYGPGEHPDRLVPGVINALLRGQAIDCTDGDQRRDFIHVDDVGAALARLLVDEIEGPVNVATGQTVTVADVLRRIEVLVGSQGLVRLGARPRARGEASVVAADNAKLRATGWTPLHSLEDGLRDTIAWWRTQPQP